MHWQVLVPIKPAAEGKSRLRSATQSAPDHLRLVEAIQLDTLDAVLPLLDDLVARVTLISPDRAAAEALIDGRPVTVVDDLGVPLNAALSAAAAEAGTRAPRDGVLVLLADLPSLSTPDLRTVLAAAAGVDRGFVADREGSGTTMLTSLDATLLAPAFGPGSAAAHRAAGAHDLPVGFGGHADVDTADDLFACLAAGVGPCTALVMTELGASGGLNR